jgi:hypothetical protein
LSMTSNRLRSDFSPPPESANGFHGADEDT